MHRIKLGSRPYVSDVASYLDNLGLDVKLVGSFTWLDVPNFLYWLHYDVDIAVQGSISKIADGFTGLLGSNIRADPFDVRKYKVLSAEGRACKYGKVDLASRIEIKAPKTRLDVCFNLPERMDDDIAIGDMIREASKVKRKLSPNSIVHGLIKSVI